jgi:hypothetical protein
MTITRRIAATLLVAAAGLVGCPVAQGDPATPGSGISSGKTYAVTTSSIEGSTPDGRNRWSVQVGQLTGGDPAVVEAFNSPSETSARELLDFVRTDWGYTEFEFESRGRVTIRPTAIAQLIGGTVYCCAHPTGFVRTIVIDSRTAQPITLADVFGNEQDGLIRLSEQTKTLGPGNYEIALPMPDMPGNAPTAANFANWIPTADGMEIYFEEYQFGDRLPGTLVVPWSALTDVLAPDMVVLARG